MESSIKPYLRWSIGNGMSYMIGDSPVSRYATAPLLNTTVQENMVLTSSKSHPAFKCNSLEELKLAMAKFEGCDLRLTAHNLVFADGNPKAKIMLIGEAPGAEEDLQGLPFVGQSGKLLDKILACIGLDRTKIYITNIVPWRPPGNRTPTAVEIVMYQPFLEQHIALIDPEILILLGGVSAKTILNTVNGIMKLRGRWFSYVDINGKKIPTLPTFHPAYLLRSPRQKELIWQDMLVLRQKMSACVLNFS